MTGTLLNTAAVVLGSAAGLAIGARLPERFQRTALQAIGLTVLMLGLSMALRTESVLIVLVSLVAGGIAGEALQIEQRLDALTRWLYRRLEGVGAGPPDGAALEAEPLATASGGPAPGGAARFSQGLITASLVYCVGPMTILGSIQDGLQGDFRILAIKSALDGAVSVAFASSMGLGVVFSALVVLIYQGLLTLGAGLMRDWLTEAMMREMSAAGGLLMVGISLRLLEIKRLPVVSLLPALVLAPLLVAVSSALTWPF